MNVGAPRWAAVIITYEAGDLLARAVDSVMADDSAGPVELVVVDNGSSDGSVDALRRTHPHVTIVDPGTNTGYAGGANRGAAATTAPIVAVLNADLEVRRGSAAALVGRLDAEPDLAAAAPQLRNPDGSIYPSVRAVPSPSDAVGHAVLGGVWSGNPFTRRYRQLDADASRPRDVEWASGAGLWLRRSALASIGGWDESYFMYLEDVDLCWRLRRLGWRIAYEPGGVADHVQGASTAHHPYRMIVRHHRSAYRFASKRWQGPRRYLLPGAAVVLTGRAAVAVGATAGSTAWARRGGATTPVNTLATEPEEGPAGSVGAG